MTIKLQPFLQQIRSAIENGELLKISFGKKRNKDEEIKNILIKCVEIKNVAKLSFVYRYPTRDITKNFDIPDGIKEVGILLQQTFYNADVFTSKNDFHLLISEDNIVKILTRPPSHSKKADTYLHDKQKTRIIKADNNISNKLPPDITAINCIR